MRNILLASAASILLLAACGEKPAPTATISAPAKPAFGEFGVDVSQMDTSIKPGDDFFRYVNGKWLATFKIPADLSSYGTFDALVDKSEADVRGILEDLGKTPQTAGTTPAKAADLYASWMDEAAIEARGTEPLKPWLDKVAAAKSKDDVVALMSSINYDAPFALSIDADPGDPTKYVVWIGQSGLGMPNRDYYLNKGETFDRYRAAYKAYVTKIFELSGDAAPAASADKVIALETKLAAVQWAPERQRNVKEAINPMDVSALQKLAPAVDWTKVLAGFGLTGVTHVIVGETTAIRDGAKLLDTQPVDAWKKYLAFHVASGSASSLPKAFDEASFHFYRKTLGGAEQQRERWKRGVLLLDRLMGEGAGEIYVGKYFPPENKAKMDALVANLRAGLDSRLKTLAWMDDATRAEAQKKLGTFEPRIGYPVKWRDYSKLNVDRTKLYENVINANQFEWDRRVSRLNQPVDRAEWDMNPQEVNAYYNPLMNQITFPAAILQPPFFDPNADPAVNYGAIGAIIGHEIGHGFDDQGREFDETGKIRNWWTPATNDKFKAATARLGKQYDSYCPLPDTCVKGELTMGENLGDLGGLEMAYAAYHLSLEGKEAPVIGGFTGDQRFFLAYAQAWQEMLRDDTLRQLLLTNPHSPGVFRANGAVRNVDAWYTAFDVKEGDKLYIKPEDRVHIW